MKNLFLALRKILFWTHLVAGVTAGLIILVMALTGTVISFERQINEAANGFKITVPADGRKLGPEELLAALKQAAPETAPTAMTVRSEADAPVAFQFGREKTLFVDPYTGQVLGEGAKKTRAFFQFVTGLHRWLALQGDMKDVGQGITSAAALIFFFIILSGLYLWIPKRWTRRGIKVVTTFQGGLKGRARDWNWHNVLGIWFAVPLLILSLTGVIMAYPWANKLLFGLVGEQPPQRGQEGGGGGERRQAEGQGSRPGREGGGENPARQGEAAPRPEGGEGDRPRGEGRRRREGGGGDSARAGDATRSDGGEGDRPGGEGRRRREGGASPEDGMPRREGGGRGPQSPAVWPASTAGWNAAFAVAQDVSSDWQSIQFQMPKGADAVFAISDSHRARPDLRQSVTINLATTAITKTEKFENQSLGRRLRNWVRWVHTGEAGGWPGQLLAGLSTLAAVVLVWTGLALSWRRFFKKKAAKKAQAFSPAA